MVSQIEGGGGDRRVGGVLLSAFAKAQGFANQSYGDSEQANQRSVALVCGWKM